MFFKREDMILFVVNNELVKTVVARAIFVAAETVKVREREQKQRRTAMLRYVGHRETTPITIDE